MHKLFKLLFTSILLISTLIAISAQSWLGMWIALEINLLSFIPLMNNSKNMMSTESSIKYFVTQALASTILLFSLIMMSMNSTMWMINESSTMMFNSALLTKMGAAPFHFWFPEVIEGLSWSNSLILLTWQKIAPMVMLMYNLNTSFMAIIIVFCMIIGGVMGINQISLRKILAYSSINHIGWMIASMMFMETIWIYYFLVYALMTFNIIYILNKQNIFFLKQLFNSMKNQHIMKTFFMMNFLSLGGLPPFIGFLPKWITIQLMIQNSFIMIAVVMIVTTLITLFFYIRISLSTLVLSANEINFFVHNKQANFNIIVVNFLTVFGLVYCTMIFNIL
uniref:NADH-ubiquinone oxidoreductase chain 2 n=1 Tax=Helochares sp. BMNH1425100 TaxID=2558027 RepID=A0A191ZRE0_9COLE|nr:NADH dehydrogenase subunit 2 [Helochares sp. BMNH1425100]